MEALKQKKKEITKMQEEIGCALVVEDDRTCRKLLEKQLFELDYEVETVKDAQSAIQLIKSKSYSLILTDLGLPDQSGESVIQAARKCELNQVTPLIVCTAYADQKTEQACLALEADKVLIKPILLNVLQGAIEQCCLISGQRIEYQLQLAIIRKRVKKFLQLQKFVSEIEEREIACQLRFIAQQYIQILNEYLQ